MDMEFDDIAQLVRQIVTDMRDSHVSLVKDVIAETLRHTATDHDAVVRLVVLVEQTNATLTVMQTSTETRLRELEQTRWKMAGMIGLASMLFAAGTALLAHFLSK